ncbi:MAG: 1,4-dihydroxy-2-naphthoate octaprenyltransferase [Cellvibrionaceae bacterium]|jgi:1,4-dihydroxy-2-naphthoate octaprenyltransferase
MSQESTQLKQPTKKEAWIIAARPRTLPLALASIALGGFLAGGNGKFNLAVVLLSGLCMTFMQILSNFANDYGDTKHGADSDQRDGPKRMTQLGLISQGEMLRAIIGNALLAAVAGLAALFVAFGAQQALLIVLFCAIGGAGIWAAIAYTATDRPYGYIGLGDLFVLLFFGAVPTLGTYFLQAKTFDSLLLFPALAGGLLAVAVLNVNNMRDISSDQAAGKHSIPVRLGLDKARVYHYSLLAVAFVFAIAVTVIDYRSAWQWLFLLALPLAVQNGRQIAKLSGPQLDPMLKKTVLLTVVFVLTFGLGWTMA